MRVRDGHEIVRTVSPRFSRPVIRVVGDTSIAEVVAGIGTWRWTLPSSRTESDEGKVPKYQRLEIIMDNGRRYQLCYRDKTESRSTDATGTGNRVRVV